MVWGGRDRDANPLASADGFTELYRRHADPLLRFFARRVYDPEAALDLTSETFAQALLSRRRFRGHSEAEAAAWVRVIAERQLARYYRSGEIERRALERIGVEVPPLTDADIERIEELAGLGELKAAIGNGLAEISEGQRSALRLRVIEELPYAEVAAQLGISPQTARARVSRALRSLAKTIDEPPTTKEATG